MLARHYHRFLMSAVTGLRRVAVPVLGRVAVPVLGRVAVPVLGRGAPPGLRRVATPGPLVFVIAILAVLGAMPVQVSAHTNDVAADPQVSADGTVVLETVFIGTDGWVVLHATNGSDPDTPGEPLGHTAVSSEGGLQEDVRVSISRGAWHNWTDNRTVWAVLHADDGDGQFEPDEDEVIEQFGEPAGQRFPVRSGDAPSYVTARGFSPQETDDATVTIRAVALPEDGYVVVHNASGGDPGDGEVVGVTHLPAGTSRAVSVELDSGFFRSRRGEFALRAVAYTDDGDGTFDGGDSPVRVGSRVVQSRFGVEKTGGPTPTAPPPTDDTNTDTDTGTETGGTAPPPDTPTPTDQETPPSTTTATAAADRSATTTGAGAPGFGPGETLLVGLVAAVAFVAIRR